jgi:stage V sporulation protein AC
MNNKNEVISNLINKSNPKRSILKNIMKAFIIGGLICLIAQIINGVLNIFLNEKISSILATIIMIFLSSFLTAFGVYDKIGQFAGAGTIIPITGFANSVTSSAMEYKSEGIVTGIINNMLKLAGSIIVTGIISAFIVSTILFLLGA